MISLKYFLIFSSWHKLPSDRRIELLASVLPSDLIWNSSSSVAWQYIHYFNQLSEELTNSDKNKMKMHHFHMAMEIKENDHYRFTFNKSFLQLF